MRHDRRTCLLLYHTTAIVAKMSTPTAAPIACLTRPRSRRWEAEDAAPRDGVTGVLAPSRSASANRSIESNRSAGFFARAR